MMLGTAPSLLTPAENLDRAACSWHKFDIHTNTNINILRRANDGGVKIFIYNF